MESLIPHTPLVGGLSRGRDFPLAPEQERAVRKEKNRLRIRLHDGTFEAVMGCM
jgi:hypothetical protein